MLFRRVRPIPLRVVLCCLVGLVATSFGVVILPEDIDEGATGLLGRVDDDPQLVKYQESPTSTTSAPAPTATVLECFQVAQPVLTPDGPSTSDGSEPSTGEEESCTVLLMDHIFAFSYGMPFVGNYTPPSCAFNRVLMNFTAVSQGRQFDRLALMYFGDTEVWRTSTAEPVAPPGIRWTYLKDMTEYLFFWRSPQTLIFDLGNLIDDRYTGPFNTTLTATFFMADVETDDAPPADLIIPVSARKGATNEVSQFTLPLDNATNTISFPQNVERAVFTVSANGQATEEFWWSNVLQTDVATFNDTSGALYGLSPFREVQVLIDGQIAGVDWPFPVIFTGGVVPSLHRPIVGLQAFDLREHQIDITPFLPVLCDGAEHTFTIQVAGIQDDGISSGTLTDTVNDSWYVTGKIFVWLADDQGAVTTGTPPIVNLGAPSIEFSRAVTQNATGANETLTFSLAVSRSLSITSTVINAQNGSSAVTWSQDLTYTNDVAITEYGFTQINDFLIDGTDVASVADITSYKAVYGYPLYANQTYGVSPQGNLTIRANLIEGLELQNEGKTVFPTGLEAFATDLTPDIPKFAGSSLSTRRDGTAAFFQTGDGRNSSGYGSTNQIFTFSGFTSEGGGFGLYSRNVTVVNQTVVADSETLAGEQVLVDFALPVNEVGPSIGPSTLFAEAPAARGGIVDSKVLPGTRGMGQARSVRDGRTTEREALYLQSP